MELIPSSNSFCFSDTTARTLSPTKFSISSLSIIQVEVNSENASQELIKADQNGAKNLLPRDT